MTRVNLGIPPRNLCDQHLLAEHREMKRIPNVMVTGRFNWKNIPLNFTLGTGHVKFFYNKLDILMIRAERIYNECMLRDFNVQSYADSYSFACEKFQSRIIPYEITQNDIHLINKRLTDKLENMKSIRYYKKDINAQRAIEILNS